MGLKPPQMKIYTFFSQNVLCCALEVFVKLFKHDIESVFAWYTNQVCKHNTKFLQSDSMKLKNKILHLVSLKQFGAKLWISLDSCIGRKSSNEWWKLKAKTKVKMCQVRL